MTHSGTERKVFRVTGPDREHFLQGLITNDIKRLREGLVYAAMLTPQGKYLADFFLVPASESILIDVHADLAAGLVQRLSMYKLRASVDIAPTDLIVSRGLGPAPDGAFPDPRCAAMGWRHYGNTDLSEDIDWNALRVAHLIPESGIELTPESYILECGFERLNGVDFRKGCYVGQEVTARMKHKTDLRKGLARVALDGTAETGTEIMAQGKPAGTLCTVSEDRAIAYLRFDRAKGDMTAGAAKVRLIE